MSVSYFGFGTRGVIFAGLFSFAAVATAQDVAPRASKVVESGSQETAVDVPVWDEMVSRSPWVFLGDSNTYAGGYVAILDAWIPHDLPSRPKLLNLGMSSETAAGTSEVDHPFKRPCVHERLDKVLAMTKPGVVFVCYGMNDGIYQPPNDENMAAYRAGMLKLAQAVKACGAKLVCLTPPIFEPEPVAAKGKLGPSENGRYAYFAPAENYDEVVKQQAAWCMRNEIGADLVIDVHRWMQAEKKERLKEDENFSFTGDGVHFGMEAHGLLAELILKRFSAPSEWQNAYPSKQAITAATKKMKLLRDAYLSATGKNRPGLPAGLPIWYAEQLVQRQNTP